MPLMALIVSLLLNIFQHNVRDDDRSAKRSQQKAESAQSFVLPSDAVNIRWHPDEQECQSRKDRFRWSKDGPAWVGTVFAFLAFIISVFAYRETARQADITREQLENTDRPWIKVLGIENPHIGYFIHKYIGKPEENLAVFFGKTNIINVGRTTTSANEVIEFVIHKWQNGWSDIGKEIEKSCQEARAGGPIDTLFPGDQVGFQKYGQAPALSEENISQKEGIKYIAPIVVGCVDYKFSTSDRHHQTRFVFEVVRNPERTRIFPVGKDVPSESIFLIRDTQYDYAD